MEQPSRHGRLALTGAAVSAGFLLLAAALCAYPGYESVSYPPLSQLVAMRRLVFACCALLLVAIAISAAIRLRRGPVGIVAGGAAVVAVLLSVTVWAPAGPGEPTGSARAAQVRGTLRILSWNTNQDAVPATEIVRLVRQKSADIVVLPEYFGPIAEARLSDLLSRYDLYSWESSAASLLVKKSNGRYRVDTSGVPPWAGFIARPEDRHLPTIVVAHLQRATFFDGADWRRDLQWAEEACSTASTIAVGDFNATVENLPRQRLNACTDAATSVGADGAGTWPTLLPAFLGARIDHVFLGSRWDTKSFQVLTGDSASDHRPIFATIGEK